MEYRLYKLEFTGGVHFGTNSLDSTEYTFAADTLFSALCQEAVKRGTETLDTLLQYANRDKLCFSDAFPYMSNCYYLPKPLLHIENADQNGDSIIKKAYKKLKYIPSDLFGDYLKGSFPVESAGKLDELGTTVIKVSASVRGEEETRPYRVGVFYYNEGCGLYFIAGYEDEQVSEFLEDLLESLSFSGIGGKRNSGLGRFELHSAKVPDGIRKRLEGNGGEFMSLSVSLPMESELEDAVEGSHYLLSKRSGFVASEYYAPEQTRKKDLYVFTAGSCFHHKFRGGIYDVSSHGEHPVYRYAKPLFLEVGI